jgi:hypothetical protein
MDRTDFDADNQAIIKLSLITDNTAGFLRPLMEKFGQLLLEQPLLRISTDPY